MSYIRADLDSALLASEEARITLQIDHEVAPWSEDKEVDNLNKTVTAAFAQAYPEYKDAFSG